MMANVKISKEQAIKMARLIYLSKFRMFGICNFDVSVYEFADILEVAFNEHIDTNALVGLNEMYEELLSKLS